MHYAAGDSLFAARYFYIYRYILSRFLLCKVYQVMNKIRVFSIIELNPELTLSNNACTGTMAIPSFVERHTTIVFRGFLALTGKP